MRDYLNKYFIGFSYGISFPLTLVILDYRLKDAGLSNSAIGLFTLLHATFMLKFLWGALIDNFDIPWLQKKISKTKSWILASHTALIVGIICMALCEPSTHLWQLIISASLVAIADGCKNIVLYPYQIQNTSDENIGYTANMVSLGHRIGTIAIKVLTLQVAYFFNWKCAYFVAALLVAILTIIVLNMKEPQVPRNKTENLKDSFYESVVLPFKKLLTEHNGTEIIAILMLYKAADFMMQKMSLPFFVEIGFSKLQIANIVQLFGSTAVIIGGFIGGYIIKKIGVIQSMIVMGAVHTCTFFLYLLLIKYKADTTILTILIFCEGITGGGVTASLLAFLYKLCKTGTQYALLWAFYEMGSLAFMSMSGILADLIGWQYYFTFVPFMSLPALWLLRKNTFHLK